MKRMLEFYPNIGRAEIFGALAVIVSAIRYATYLHAMYHGTAKPHVFSWFNWGLLVAIGAVAQIHTGGGPSVWALVTVSAMCFFIALLSLWVGEKNITRSDWFAFIGALLGIAIWQTTNDPIITIALLIVIDIACYYPTYRKSWADPWGEPPGSYFWAGLRYFLALLAVPEFIWAQMFYPIFLMLGDWLFMGYIIWRRAVLTKVNAPAYPPA